MRRFREYEQVAQEARFDGRGNARVIHGNHVVLV